VTIALIFAVALADLALIVLCVRACRRRRLTAAAVLFGLNLVGVLVLGRLGAIDDQTAALQWVEQSVNTVAAAAFATAAWLLARTET
jgi:hypothetical protein